MAQASGYNEANESSTQSDSSNTNQNVYSTESTRLMAKIEESRRKGISLSNPIVEKINRNTTRVEKGFITKKFEFKDRKGIFIKSGKPYHIHYTKDLSVHYMSSAEHNVFSELIYPTNKKNNLIGYYNTLNQQEPIFLKAKTNAPKAGDYGKGFFNRTFAKKTNEVKAQPFEIESSDLNISPLYDYINMTWYLSGTPESVELANRRKIELAAENWPNITGLLNPFQYYRRASELTPVQLIRERLGESIEEQIENDSATTTKVKRRKGGKKGGKGRKGKGSYSKTNKSQTKSNTQKRTTTTSTSGASGGGGGSSSY